MRRVKTAGALNILTLGFFLLLAATFLMKSAKAAIDNSTEIRALMSGGMKAPMEAIRAQAQQIIGRPLNIEYGRSTELKPKIEAGELCDVALVTPDILDDLIKQGKIVAGSRVDVAHVPVAIGQRGDAPTPDITTLDGLKRALLNAKVVVYAPKSASYAAAKKAFEQLGIVEEMKAKNVEAPTPTLLGAGETELDISLASEILSNKNLKFVGLLPAEVQVPATMSAGVCSNSNDKKGADSLIQFLRGPAIEPSLKANGMQR